MNYSVLLSILFELLEKRRVTALELSKKHSLSPRTIYRYVTRLSAFLPLHVQRGRGGGIYLSDAYRLPVDFLNEAEYLAVAQALLSAYEQNPKEVFLSAKRKIAAVEKQAAFSPIWTSSADICILPSPKNQQFSTLFSCLQKCLEEKRVVRILLREKKREEIVEPHLLVLREEKWYLYAFCHTKRDFLLFPLDEMRGVLYTEELFRPRSYDKNAFLEYFPEKSPILY